MDGPYRSARIRGGVALPRGAMSWWQVATFFAASSAIVLMGWFVTADVLRDHTVLLVGLGFVFLVDVVRTAGPIAAGRSDRTSRAITVALAPALLGEMWATTRLPAWRRLAIAESPHSLGTELFHDIAMVRLWAYALTAVAAFTVAVAATGLVLGVRREGNRGSLVPSVVAGAIGLVFAVLRLRDWHRDGLAGALPLFGLVAGAALAPLLVGRVRALADWHDREERRSVAHGGWVALVALTLATLSAERALLASEEAHDLSGLRQGRAFEERYELVHALAGSIAAHHLALAILAGAFVVILAGASRDLAPRVARGWGMLAVVATVLALSTSTELRVRGALVEPPGPPVPFNVDLPRVEQAQVLQRGRPGVFLPLVEQVEPKVRPVAFVADRHEPTRRLFEVTRGWWGGSIEIAVTAGPPPVGLGKLAPLVGPRWATLDFDIGTFGAMKSGRGLLVLDDGGTARVRLLGGAVRGISLQPDDETQTKRRRLGVELGSISTVLVAPAPNGDIEALARLLLATRDLTHARVVVTSEYQTMSDRIEEP